MWRDVQHSWQDMLGQIVCRWPATAAEDLMKIEGDRSRFTDYLARAHDLTRAEAEELIENWLWEQRLA
ncbi:MAG: hypothetical protein AAFY77_11905 [Pseudomonadota bacterium]